MVGCLGCAIAKDIIFLNLMRALTGLGGGGLMTMGKGEDRTKEQNRTLTDYGA